MVNPEIRPGAEDPASGTGGHRLCIRLWPSREQALCPPPGLAPTGDCMEDHVPGVSGCRVVSVAEHREGLPGPSGIPALE